MKDLLDDNDFFLEMYIGLLKEFGFVLPTGGFPLFLREMNSNGHLKFRNVYTLLSSTKKDKVAEFKRLIKLFDQHGKTQILNEHVEDEQPPKEEVCETIQEVSLPKIKTLPLESYEIIDMIPLGVDNKVHSIKEDVSPIIAWCEWIMVIGNVGGVDPLQMLNYSHKLCINDWISNRPHQLNFKNNQLATMEQLNTKLWTELHNLDLSVCTLKGENSLIRSEINSMRREMSNMKEEHTKEINLMQERHTKEINLMQERHTNEINLITEKNTKEINLIKEEHTKEINLMKEQIASLMEAVSHLNIKKERKCECTCGACCTHKQ